MDFDQIRQALEIAGASGTAVKNLGSGVEAIRNVFKSSGKEMSPEVKSLLVDLAGNVADAKLANAELTQKLAELQLALQKQESFENRKACYEMVETPAGNMLYRLREDVAGGQPVHYACPVCMEKDQISILQVRDSSAQCIPCKHMYRINPPKSFYDVSM